MTLLLLVSTFFSFQQGLYFIPVFIVASFLLTYFSLLEGIKRIGWYGLFFMPIVVSVSFFLFYFLFPGRWLTRLPFIVVYGVSIYATLLCSNIFDVGVEKNLQLYRAAFSVNFFFQSIAMFFLLNLLVSLESFFLVNVAGVGVIGFLFALQLLWTIRLNKHLEREIVSYAVFIAVILSELILILSFAPIPPVIVALLVTAAYYSLSGLSYHFIDQKLFKETVREYVVVLVFVSIIALLSLSW